MTPASPAPRGRVCGPQPDVITSAAAQIGSLASDSRAVRRLTLASC